MYCCPPCRAFCKHKEKENGMTCEKCGNLLIPLKVTDTIWQAMSNEEKKDLISMARSNSQDHITEKKDRGNTSAINIVDNSNLPPNKDMFLYCCKDCKKIATRDNERSEYNCPTCGKQMRPVGITEGQWKNLDNNKRREAINNVCSEPDINKNEEENKYMASLLISSMNERVREDAASVNQSEDEQINPELNCPHYSERKKDNRYISVKKLCTWVACVTAAYIFVIVGYFVQDKLKDPVLNDLKLETQTYIIFADDSINPPRLSSAHSSLKLIDKQYKNASQETQSKYRSWVGKEYNISLDDMYYMITKYGIVLERTYKEDDYEKMQSNFIVYGPYFAKNINCIDSIPCNEMDIAKIADDYNLENRRDDVENVNNYAYLFTDNNQKENGLRPPIWLKIQNKGDSVELICSLIYWNKDAFSFYDSVEVSIDGNKINIPITEEIERKKLPTINTYTENCYMTISPNDEIYDVLKMISNENYVSVEFKGKSNAVKSLDELECSAIKIMLFAYEEMISGNYY